MAVQPLPLFTITVYDTPEVGVMTSAEVVIPVFQEYVPPPDAVSVALCPLQTMALPVMATVGDGLDVIVTVAVSAAQLPLETITEYVALAVGVIVIEVVVAPVFQE